MLHQTMQHLDIIFLEEYFLIFSRQMKSSKIEAAANAVISPYHKMEKLLLNHRQQN